MMPPRVLAFLLAASCLLSLASAQYDVIVIGSGMSGMAAANKLKAAGKKVTNGGPRGGPP